MRRSPAGIPDLCGKSELDRYFQVLNKNTYLDSTEVYQELSAYISDYLSTDQDFSKMLYKYLLLDDEITGKQLCTVLYEQGTCLHDDEDYQNFKSGNLSSMDLMLRKISSLEITPAQLALDPCSVRS